MSLGISVCVNVIAIWSEGTRLVGFLALVEMLVTEWEGVPWGCGNVRDWPVCDGGDDKLVYFVEKFFWSK